jgi:hypothetical protein
MKCKVHQFGKDQQQYSDEKSHVITKTSSALALTFVLNIPYIIFKNLLKKYLRA